MMFVEEGELATVGSDIVARHFKGFPFLRDCQKTLDEFDRRNGFHHEVIDADADEILQGVGGRLVAAGDDREERITAVIRSSRSSPAATSLPPTP